MIPHEKMRHRQWGIRWKNWRIIKKMRQLQRGIRGKNWRVIKWARKGGKDAGKQGVPRQEKHAAKLRACGTTRWSRREPSRSLIHIITAIFFFSTNNNSPIFQRDLEIIFSERQSMLFKVLRSAVGRRSASEFSSFNARFGFLINTFFYFKQHFSQSGITV